MAHEQRRLEELGVGLDDFFDMSQVNPKMFSKKAEASRKDAPRKEGQKKDAQRKKSPVNVTPLKLTPHVGPPKKEVAPRMEAPVKAKKQEPRKEKVSRKPELEPSPMPVQGPATRSYIPTKPRATVPKQFEEPRRDKKQEMTKPVMVSSYAGEQVVDDDAPVTLDVAKKPHTLARPEEVLEDPSKHHFYMGQQHREHEFSLMDPVHPAKHDM